MSEIDPIKAIEDVERNISDYAESEAHKVYVEEMRKTIKAELMKDAEADGHKTAAMQEREAYANPNYKRHLLALKEAVRRREELRWKMIAAQAKVDIWRSQEASNRRIDRMTV